MLQQTELTVVTEGAVTFELNNKWTPGRHSSFCVSTYYPRLLQHVLRVLTSLRLGVRPSMALAVAAAAWAVLVPAAGQAAEEARVEVSVVMGVRGGAGIDASAQDHAGVLGRIGGFGGWKLTQTFALKVGPGQTASQKAGPRSFEATLHSVAGGKARTTLVVKEPGGTPHKVTSSLANGASTAITVEASDGTQVHVFIVRISY